MTGYVFHCTPCGNAHAGECPPKEMVGCSPGAVAGHFNTLDTDHFPYVGTTWRKYILLKGSSTWRPGIDWFVTGLDYQTNHVYIRDAYDPNDKSYKFSGEAWTELAGFVHPDGTRARFEKVK